MPITEIIIDFKKYVVKILRNNRSCKHIYKRYWILNSLKLYT